MLFAADCLLDDVKDLLQHAGSTGEAPNYHERIEKLRTLLEVSEK